MSQQDNLKRLKTFKEYYPRLNEKLVENVFNEFNDTDKCTKIFDKIKSRRKPISKELTKNQLKLIYFLTISFFKIDDIDAVLDVVEPDMKPESIEPLSVILNKILLRAIKYKENAVTVDNETKHNETVLPKSVSDFLQLVSICKKNVDSLTKIYDRYFLEVVKTKDYSFDDALENLNVLLKKYSGEKKFHMVDYLPYIEQDINKVDKSDNINKYYNIIFKKAVIPRVLENKFFTPNSKLSEQSKNKLKEFINAKLMDFSNEEFDFDKFDELLDMISKKSFQTIVLNNMFIKKDEIMRILDCGTIGFQHSACDDLKPKSVTDFGTLDVIFGSKKLSHKRIFHFFQYLLLSSIDVSSKYKQGLYKTTGEGIMQRFVYPEDMYFWEIIMAEIELESKAKH